MFDLFKEKPVEPKEPDMVIQHYELIGRLFGIEEAKKSLLNVLSPTPITSEMVLSDSAALEQMMGGNGWTVFERAVWVKLLTSFRLSLAAKTLEERESGRNQTMAFLACLHLPYELKFAADNIRKMKELEKSVRDAQAR